MVATPDHHEPRLLTLAEASTRAGVSVATVRRWCRSGELASVAGRPGDMLVLAPDLDAHLASRAAGRPDRSRPGPAQVEPAIGLGAPRPSPLPWRDDPTLRYATRLRIIEDLTLRLNGIRDIPQIGATIVSEVGELVDADAYRVYLIDRRQELCVEIAHRDRDPDRPSLVEIRFVPVGKGVTGWVAQRGIPVLLSDAARDPRAAWVDGSPEPTSLLAVPMSYEDEVRGVIVLTRLGVARFDEEDLVTLSIVAGHAAQAIRNSESFDRLARQQEDLEQRLRAQRSLLQIAEQLQSRRDPQSVLACIADSLQQVVENDALLILRVDRAAGVLRLVLSRDPLNTVDFETLPLGTGLSGWVAEHGEAAIANDAGHDPRTIILPGTSEENDSLIVVPLISDGEVVGTLNVTRFGEGRYFSEVDLELTKLFAAQAAVALQNAERFEQLDRQRAELERHVASQRMLLQVSEQLLLTLNPEAVLRTIGDALGAVVAYDVLSIHRVDEAQGIRRFVYGVEAGAAMAESDHPLFIGLSAWVMAKGEAVLSNRSHLDPRRDDVPWPLQPQAMIVAPLYTAGRVTGLMYVVRRGEEACFSDDEFELVKLFAAQASIALQNAAVHQRVTDLAERDSLTGLRNRGSFEEDITELLDRHAPFALVMLDLDDFKSFNDRFGHLAGDERLRSIARAMNSATRGADGLYRYGGDEFAVLLPGASRGQALDIVERLRQAVASSESPGGVRIGLSAGVARYPDDATAVEDLIGQADASLYRVKRAAEDAPDPASD